MTEGTAQQQEYLSLRAAVQRDPGDFIAWVMLADSELERGDIAAGETASLHALRLRPGHPEALARQGRVRWNQGRHAEAVEMLQQASDLVPDHPGIALWLGHALEDAGQAEAAARAYERSHALCPQEPYIAAQLLNWRRKLCDWRGVDALSQQVRHAVAHAQTMVEPFAFLNEDASPAEQLTCARTRARSVTAQAIHLPPRTHRVDGPLRLGFLSNGFGAHPTGLLTVALFEAIHARHEVETHLFAINGDDASPIRRRLQAASTLYDVAGVSHAQIAARIRGAGIDLLFDLRGWGGGGAPEVLAMRPAPVQVNWLAYPGTSGAPWIDYVLADGYVLPPELEPHFSETVVRLARCFQPSDTTRLVAAPPPRNECGLPDRGTVFCCFNNSYKLNPRSFARMLAILARTPQSVLWLLSGSGLADQRLRAVAAAQGIDPARLVFMPKLPHEHYLARYQHADLFLDTAPYNAHTTASDALWAGCPVLTLPGQNFAARVAGSLNHHLGLGQMNMADEPAFILRAVELGNDSRVLADLRQQLARARLHSSVFDMQAFASEFLDCARRMATKS